MHISDRKVVKSHSSSSFAKKSEILKDDIGENDIIFEKGNKNEEYVLGGLSAIDLNYNDYFDNHSENPEKSFSGDSLPLMKWISVVCDSAIDFEKAKAQGRKKGDKKGPWPSKWKDTENTEHYIIFTNDIINKDFFSLQDHPKLQWLLMCMVGVGELQNHQWLSLSSSKKSLSKLDEMLITIYNNISKSEIDLLKNINSEEELIDLAKRCGKQDKEIESIEKEIREWKDQN